MHMKYTVSYIWCCAVENIMFTCPRYCSGVGTNCGLGGVDQNNINQ